MADVIVAEARRALDVANYYIEYSGYTKTNLQILKLTYIAHGYTLAIHNRPLITDRVEAWKRGPVIPGIYNTFKRWGSGVIGATTYTPKPFSASQDEILQAVYAEYGKYCGYYLSQITHEDGELKTPWLQCYEAGLNAKIPNDITKEYYKQLIDNE